LRSQNDLLNQKPKTMKRILLFLFAVTIGVASMAQLSRLNYPRIVKDVPATVVDIPVANPVQPSNTFVNSKSVLENDLGLTHYDVQSNASIQNRIFSFPDGTISGIWTCSMQDATYSDRGTGYNYYDGSAWGTPVSTRLETSKTGWPSYAAWNGNGEIVMAHKSSTSYVTNTRPVKGTGSWTQSLMPLAPTGVPAVGWPRMITSGTTNQYIHVLGLSLPTGNPPGVIYNGLDGALLYWRSLDGGTNWDKVGIQIPGLDSSNYSSFSGDEYAWGTPHGDTLYFAVAGPYTDAFIMKSIDNGENWTKIPILSNDLYKKLGTTLPSTLTIPPWRSSDGAMACEMDKSGVIHFVSGIGGGSVTDGSKFIRLNNNGLIYWNTTMPMLQDSLNLDTLDAHGQLLGYYSDGPNPGDTLHTVTSYRVGLTSFPQISFDAYNNMYVIYSGVTWANPDPASDINFRHIFGRAKFHDQATWSTDPIDLNESFSYIFQEFVFASMAKNIYNDKLALLYQTANQPGTAVGTSTATNPIPPHESTIQYREVPGSTFWPTGIARTDAIRSYVGQNYPNPVKGTTSFKVAIDKAATIVVEVANIMGQKVMILDKGVVNAGAQIFTIDCSSLNSGVYFYTVKINSESYTHKMIVE
jgi:hypothetical protein